MPCQKSEIVRRNLKAIIQFPYNSQTVRLCGSKLTEKPIERSLPSPPRHPDVGVNLRGGDAFVPQQGLDVHPFGPGVEPVGGVSMTQLVGRNLFFNTGLLEHPPQVSAAPVGPLYAPSKFRPNF